MSQAVILGGALGLGVGCGFYALRLKQWAILWPVAILVLCLTGIGIAGGALLAGVGLPKGGDAAMNSATVLAMGGIGLVASLGVMLVVGFVQNATVRRSLLRCSMSLALDVIVVACLAWGYQSIVVRPQERNVTDEWWQLELQRRNQRKAELERIPEKYRHWTIPMIEAHRNEQIRLAKRGQSLPSPMPQDVENAIRNYINGGATSVQPVPDRARYAQLGDDRKGFQLWIALGWLAGAVLIPLGGWLIRDGGQSSG